MVESDDPTVNRSCLSTVYASIGSNSFVSYLSDWPTSTLKIDQSTQELPRKMPTFNQDNLKVMGLWNGDSGTGDADRPSNRVTMVLPHIDIFQAAQRSQRVPQPKVNTIAKLLTMSTDFGRTSKT
jgi:hypothetical protein